MSTDFPFFIAGRAERGAESLTVTSPFDGAVAGTYSVPTAEQVDRAVQAAALRHISQTAPG